jgi:hypothetical protein
MQVTAAVDVDGQLTGTVRGPGPVAPAGPRPRRPRTRPADHAATVDGVVAAGRAGHDRHAEHAVARSPEDSEDRPGGTSTADVVVDRSAERPWCGPPARWTRSAPSRCASGCWRPATGGTGRVELDLTAVTLFSSAAVRVVLAMARIAGAEGWRLVVHAPAGGVTRHVLEISGLGGLVELR